MKSIRFGVSKFVAWYSFYRKDRKYGRIDSARRALNWAFGIKSLRGK